MNKTKRVGIASLSILRAFSFFTQSAEAESKKLKMFIMAGRCRRRCRNLRAILPPWSLPWSLISTSRGRSTWSSRSGGTPKWDSVKDRRARCGSDRPYHSLGSGKFFVGVGDAFAGAMARMLPKQ